ncbi:MAG: methylated-DNA--[protein]-cysteine S-methyltransferase [Clostridia bacterium]|nr:methylated-DNA--[protein]-cysteine S-methyltransferase [Clostridia bacterium]
MYYTEFDTPLCPVILVGDEEGLSRLHMVLGDDKKGLELTQGLKRNDALFQDAKQQILEYISGERRIFELKLNPKGTDFQKKVWQALCAIPYGETRSYKEIAIMAGNDKASRAVGMANNKNPIPLIIPCHRVIGSSGQLTGYAFGLEMKERVLEIERRNVKK